MKYHAIRIFLVLFLLMPAALARVYGIENQGLWSDELFAVILSYRQHFSDIFPDLLRDSHPPGYVSFMYFTLPLIGYDDWQIRLHSLMAGISLVYITYCLGRRYLGFSHGIIAGSLVTFSYTAILYSQEARAYSMLALFCMVNLYFFLAIFIQEKLLKKNYIYFISSGVITVYLHYAGFVFIICEGVVFLLILIASNTRKKLLISASIAFLPIAVAYLPWVGPMYHHMTSINDYWGGDKKLGWREYQDLKEFIAGPSMLFAEILVYTIISSTIFASIKKIYLIKQPVLNSNVIYFFIILAMAIFPILTFYIKSLFSQTVFQNRHFLYTIPLFALICSYTLCELIALIKPRPLRYASTFVFSAYLCLQQFNLNQSKEIYTFYFKDKIREAVYFIRNDSDFISQKNTLTLSTHSGFYHYLHRYNMQHGGTYDHYYSSGHYNEIVREKSFKNIGFLYYLIIGKPSDHEFFGSARSNHKLVCIEEFVSGSGVISMAKFNLKQPANLIDSIPDCLSLQKNKVPNK